MVRRSDASLITAFAMMAVLSAVDIIFAQDDYNTWGYRDSVFLNTAGTGAGVSTDQLGFPVLIRLNPSNFSNFSETQPLGADIRFSKVDGTHLYYEIDRWVDVGGDLDTAEIWVRVDTVYGNNNSGYPFYMYYGNGGAADSSNSSAVFDTANGFRAVYHMDANIAQTLIYDATYNPVNGTNTASTTDAKGIVGRSRYFNDAAYITASDNAKFEPANLTVTAWARRAGVQGDYSKIFCKGRQTDPYASFTLETRVADTVGFQTARDPGGAGDFISTNGNAPTVDSTWFMLAGTYDQSTGIQNFFYNGTKISSDTTETALYYYATDYPLYIGAEYGNQNLFKGWIDEVSLSSGTRSADWIKLCYQNQQNVQSGQAGQLVWRFSPSNQAPTNITLIGGSVAENQPSPALVGTFSTTDPDAGQTHTYSLVTGTGSTDNASFTISGISLNTAAVFDYETKPSYSIRVRTTDNGFGSQTFEKAFTITVTDANDAPTDITLPTASVNENQASGTGVGTFTTTDQDASDTHTYSLVTGTGATDNASFSISGSTLQTAAAFDFETKSSYSVRVRTVDSGTGNLTFEKAFTITVNDINDAPTDITISSSNVSENQPTGTVVGTFSTSDQDAGQSHTYALASGGADNTSFTIDGISLKTNAYFNYEDDPSYSIRIMTTDNGTGSLTYEKNFTINVTNANDAPVINEQTFNINENSADLTVVGTVAISDEDDGDNHNYQIIGASLAGVFSINPTSGIISVAENTNLDFETYPVITLNVQVTDNGAGNLSDDAVITINVNNVNEAPVLASTSNQGTMVNATKNMTVTFSDPDAGENHTVDIQSDNANVTVSGLTGHTSGSTYDLVPATDWSGTALITVRVTDNGSLFDEDQYTLTVTNDNAAPELTPIGDQQTDEDVTKNLEVTFSDANAEDSHTLEVESDNANVTVTGPAGDTSGSAYSLVPAANWSGTANITVTVTDDGVGNFSDQETYILTVDAVNDTPSAVLLNNATVNENSAVGTFVGKFTTTDVDQGDTHTYSLVTGTGSSDNLSFTIVNDSLRTNAAMDYETKSVYSIRVRSTDEGGLHKDSAYTVNVLNVSEKPSITYPDSFRQYIAFHAIAPDTPAVSSPLDSVYVVPALPAGLTVAKLTGILSGTPTTASDTADYLFIAVNDNESDTFSMSICVLPDVDSTGPQNLSDITVNALGPTTLDIRWTTPESNDPDAEMVWIYLGTDTFPTPESPGTALVDSFELTDTAGESSITVSDIDAETKYYVSLWVTDTVPNASAAVSDTATTPEAGALINPLVVRGAKVDSGSVRISISNYAGIYSDVDPFVSYADSVGIWYRSSDYPDSPGVGTLVRYPLKAIQAVTAPYVDTISVAPLEPEGDSSYFFCISLFWRTPEGETVVPAFDTDNGAVVLMFDTSHVSMNLSDTAVYNEVDTSISITIRNSDQISPSAAVLGAWYGMTPDVDFGDPAYSKSILLDTITLSGTEYTVKFMDPAFFGVTKTVYYALVLVGANGLPSDTLVDSLSVGSPRPINGITLTAQSVNSYQILLTWSSADSVRIWYATQEVPLEYAFAAPYRAISPSKTDTSYTLSSLNALTTYHFGLQLYSEGLWSYVTEASSDSATTDSVSSTLVIPNTVTIDTVWFDAGTNSMRIGYTLDTAGLGIDSVLQIGVRYSMSGTPLVDTGSIEIYDSAKIADTVAINFSEDIISDTTYYFSLWVKIRGGPWALPTDSSIGSVYIRSVTWQQVTYFTETDTLVSAFGAKIMLLQGPVVFQAPYVDTLDIYDPGMDLPPGLVNAGIAFIFRRALQSQDFYVGISPDSVPAGVDTVLDLRIYRIVNGDYYVEHDSYYENGYVWVLTRDLTSPFIIMADTLFPVLTIDTSLCDTGAVVNEGDTVLTAFSVSDNIINVKWRFLYGNGNAGYTVADSGFVNGLDDSLLLRNIYINQMKSVFGVRAMIVIDDGVNSDTIDVSRRVLSVESDQISTSALEWVPLRVTTELVDTSAEAPLAVVAEKKGEWAYDNTVFRLFRWLPSPENATSDDKWIEYSAEDSLKFSFVPGRVIWIKTRKQSLIEFGSGVTISLKRPYEISLTGRNWTDFSVPYKFSVYLRDILASTGDLQDSLYFYKWVKEENTYTAEPFYLPGFTSLETNRDTGQIVYQAFPEVYTVYNAAMGRSSLLIPPVPEDLSVPPPVAKKGKSASGRWEIRVAWKNRKASDRMSSVFCGFNGENERNVFYPMPPSFGSVGVGVCERDGVYGHAILNSDSSGGYRYRLIFYNSGECAGNVYYTVEGLGSLPGDMKASLFNPSTGLFESDALNEMAISGKGKEFRWLVAGSAEYLAQFRKNFKVFALGLAGIFPNPVRGMAKIVYTVPYSAVSGISLTIFNLQGRKIWEKSISGGIHPGANTVMWEGKDISGNSVASGMYVLRMKATEKAGERPKVFEKRMVFLP